MADSPFSDASSDLYGGDEVEPQEATAAGARHDSAPLLTPGSEAVYEDSPLPVRHQAAQQHTAGTTKPKRRLDSQEPEPEPVKRQRIQHAAQHYFSPSLAPTAGLPAEVWQHIFLYFPPDTLSRCLRVNRAFSSYLTRLTANMSVRLPPRHNGVKVLDSDAIWTSSRKLFAPNMPRPLSGFGEMQMFQLLGGKRCQGCGAMPAHPPSAATPYTAGPGANGVRVIWSFYARLCGRCFEALSLKDVEVLVSPAAPLRAGLLYAFRTNDLHYIPPTTLQTIPAGAPKPAMSKVYARKHVDDLQQEYQNAKELGDAAAEEWIKGLASAGKLHMTDTARWERWEALYPPGSDLARVLREYFRPSSAPPVDEVQVRSTPHSGGSLQAPPSSMKYPLPQKPTQQEIQPGLGKGALASGVDAFALGTSPSQPDSFPLGHAAPQQHQQQQQQQQWRPPRTLKEATEAKAARRADIERRCQLEFQPPLLPTVLQHMESFHAAMQITKPLTDAAWEVLKARLMGQRDAAEQIEWQRAEQMRALQATMPNTAWRDSLSKNANEAADRQWEAAQAPIRKSLATFADEFIAAKYGKRLSRELCGIFAVEVLLYCRNRYVEIHKPADDAIYDDPATEAPDFVSLENMRWLFEEKVKPMTDRVMDKYSKDLFCCADCPDNRKGYAFEGLMQHFGAKHTTDFSKGNIVVHWQSAEWPEEPPFVVGAADPTIPESPKPARSRKHDGFATQSGQPSAAPQSGNSFAGYEMPSTSHSTGTAWPVTAAGVQQATQYNAPVNKVYPAYTPPAHLPHGVSYGQDTAPVSQITNQPSHIISPSAAGLQPRRQQRQQQSFAEPSSVPSYDEQLNQVSKVAREVWDSTAGVRDLLSCVRVQTVLCHVDTSFKARFGNPPTLDLITDALANHILMRPLKNANGIACKTCVSYNLDGDMAFASYEDRIAKTKLYNISSLIAHFKAVHLQTEDSGYDWKADMVELPEDDLIRALMTTVGMDDDKLATIAEAFPGIFPDPLPPIGLIRESGESFKKQEMLRLKGNKKPQRNSGTAWEQDDIQGEQSDNLPEAAEDEYDPRRPAFIESAHARSHPNGRHPNGGRSSMDTHRPAGAPIDVSALEPATIEALIKIGIPIGGVPHHSSTRPERCASVPRARLSVETSPHRGLNPADPYLRGAVEPRNGRASGDAEGRRVSGRRKRAAESDESEEDYTQIIRTAATGPYAQQSLTAHPGFVQPTRLPSVTPHDQYGRPVEQHLDPHHYAPPGAASYDHYASQRGMIQYVDPWGRPCDEHGRSLPPVSTMPLPPLPPPPPQQQPIYVDEYGRPVDIRALQRPAGRNPYDYPAYQPEYAARDDSHRVVYYDQQPALGHPTYQSQPSHYPHGYQPPPAYPPRGAEYR
ncbi:hypothetical protein MBLNU459_g3031t1 [Dothideomycetes sp. NU459]